MVPLEARRRVAIIGGNRTPFCRSHTAYRHASNQNLQTAALIGLVDRFKLQGQCLGDVSLGAVIQQPDDWNLARECVLGSNLAPQTPAFDVARACGTSLEASIAIGNKIALSQIEVGIAGGVDSVSDTPIVYSPEFRKLLMRRYRAKTAWQKFKHTLAIRPRHFKPQWVSVKEPRTGLSMGESTELMAKTWNISRQAQDEWTLMSHQRAANAQDHQFFQNLITPYEAQSNDNNVRPNTSLDKLAALKPVFDRSETGTLTAGNSTPLTDGASCALLASEDWAMHHHHHIQAYLTDVEVSAVNFVSDEGLLMAPTYAVAELLKRHRLRLQDFDYYEIHEAFAAQVLCTLAAWDSDAFCQQRLNLDHKLGELDLDKVNVCGGSLAIGHPFAATGTRLLATLAQLLTQSDTLQHGRGLISVCTGGGMGIAALIEAA